MAISDKQFDAQFDKVANLTHYPWIGICFFTDNTKKKSDALRNLKSEQLINWYAELI